MDTVARASISAFKERIRRSSTLGTSVFPEQVSLQSPRLTTRPPRQSLIQIFKRQSTFLNLTAKKMMNVGNTPRTYLDNKIEMFLQPKDDLIKELRIGYQELEQQFQK